LIFFSGTGARLVSINAVDIDPQWDLEQFYDALHNAATRRTFNNLTFRNEEWDATHASALNNAIAEISESRDVKCDSDVVTKQRRIRSFDSGQLQQACRARTGSAEAVGKAIGSFIQNFKDKHHQPRK
jgi:hypothetical protein